MQRKKRLRLEIAERQVLQLSPHHAHSQAVRNRRVNIQRLARNALLLFRFEVLQRAHVVQAVGQLDQHDAHVRHHRQKHLAHVFGLARFRRLDVQAADFRNALDQMRYFRPKTFFNARNGILRVFYGVVENCCGQRDGIQPHIGEDMRNFEQMREIRLTGTAELVVMPLRSDLVRAADDPGVLGGTVLLELFEQLFQAGVELPNRAHAVEAQRQIARRRHGLVYPQRRGKGKRRRQRFTKAQKARPGRRQRLPLEKR